MAAIESYHKYSGLKQYKHKFINLQFWRLEVQKWVSLA